MKTAYLCPTKEHFIYQVKEFLKIGVWISGSTKINEHQWDYYEENTCVTLNEWNGIEYSSNNYYEKEGYEIRTVELPKEEKTRMKVDCSGCPCSETNTCWYHEAGTEEKIEPNKPMKKYRVTKEHPFLKEGIEVDGDLSVPGGPMYSNYNWQPTIEKIAIAHPTWFEEVDSRWKPHDLQLYYFINDYLQIDNTHFYERGWPQHQMRFEAGNCFEYLSEAEEARDKVRILLLSLNN